MPATIYPLINLCINCGEKLLKDHFCKHILTWLHLFIIIFLVTCRVKKKSRILRIIIVANVDFQVSAPLHVQLWRMPFVQVYLKWFKQCSYHLWYRISGFLRVMFFSTYQNLEQYIKYANQIFTFSKWKWK